MRLAVINGSPRGEKSNSSRIVKTWMLPESGGQGYTSIYAKDVVKGDESLETANVNGYLFVFPLYVDSVPGIVKEVFERMAETKQKFAGKKAWFVIHSGFPEPKQSEMAKRYVRYFCTLIDMEYMGTAVMGNSESLQVAPDGFFGKKCKLFSRLGQNIMQEQPFDKEVLKGIAGRESLSKLSLFIMKRMNMSNMYWNKMLKKNGAFDKRFDKPYA